MKLLVVFATFILAVSAATDKDQWSQFKEKYSRDYRNLREENTRFSIFQSNLRTIEEHNERYAKGETSYYLGVTKFADLTPAEFQSQLTTPVPSHTPKLNSSSKVADADLPSSFDWRDKGVVSAVKNQGNCLSCWAFVATGGIEAAYAIKTGEKISLSEQNLVDCSVMYGNYGCNTGTVHAAFEYVKENGIEAEADYKYWGQQGACAYDQSKSVLTISDYDIVTYGSETELQKAVATIGPIGAAVDATNFQLYDGGVYDDPSCTFSVNHAVLVVGYGEQNGAEYWISKNSWGTDWGESGYIKMARNKDSQCGIALWAVYPVL